MAEMVTFEQFMTSMRELDKKFAEIQEIQRETSRELQALKELKDTSRDRKEASREFAEIREIQRVTSRELEETLRGLKETKQLVTETSLQMKETDKRLEKQLGSLGNRLGEIIEYMIIPNLMTKFEEIGLNFIRATKHSKITDKEHGIFTEVDAFLDNDDEVMIVEIKTKPSIDDINDHLERMQKLRAYADARGDARPYFGALGGVVLNESEKNYALKSGFYLIEPSGETFTITKPHDPLPRAW